MSDSGRVNISKTGLILGLLLALAICVGWIGYGLSKSAEYERQADNQRSKYAEYTRNKIAETCVGISGIKLNKCRYDAFDAQREHANNQSDLVAQRKSALWAFIMGAAAVIGMALSAVGVWLVKATFDEAKISNQMIAAEAINNTTRFIDAQNANVMTQRAVLLIKHCQLSALPLNINNGFMASFDVENIGKSTARIVRIDFHVGERAFFATNSRNYKRFNQIIAIGILTPTAKFKIKGQKAYPVYFTGSITYATIHNTEFRAFFCFRIGRPLIQNHVGDLEPDWLDPQTHQSMPNDT